MLMPISKTIFHCGMVRFFCSILLVIFVVNGVEASCDQRVRALSRRQCLLRAVGIGATLASARAIDGLGSDQSEAGGSFSRSVLEKHLLTIGFQIASLVHNKGTDSKSENRLLGAANQNGSAKRELESPTLATFLETGNIAPAVGES